MTTTTQPTPPPAGAGVTPDLSALFPDEDVTRTPVQDVALPGGAGTLALVVQLLTAGGAEVRSAVLYTKPHTLHEPEYTWRRTAQWITFPWSAEPPVLASA